MKKSIILLVVIVLLLLSFVAYTFISTGFFRAINNTQDYKVIAELPLWGTEDFTIDYESEFMIISQDDRGAFKRNTKRTGGLYFMSLENDSFDFKKLDTKEMLPHGISLFKIDSAKYQLLVVNHLNGHAIEKFELYNGDSLVHIRSYSDPSIVSPNDVVALDEERFYFTNDHGYTSKMGLLAENYLGLSASNVILFDGNDFREVAGGIGYANGINISKDRGQLLVASPRKFLLKYYDIGNDGSLRFNHDLDVGSGIDNIELDQNGDLWMGSHPNLLRFTAYAAGKKETAPSEVIKVSGDSNVESLFENDGDLISASSVAVPFKEYVFVGTVMDEHLLVLKKIGE